MTTKKCSECNEEKPATSEYFSRRKDSPDGLRATCRICRREYNRRWSEANSEHRAEYNRQWNAANKEWRAEYNRTYHEANRDAHNENSRQLRTINKKRYAIRARAWREANKDSQSEYFKAHYAANRERKAEYSRVYREAHKEAMREYRRNWHAANPGKYRVYWHVRRGRQLNALGSHTAADIALQFKSQRGKCYYCHKKVDDNYHVDHVIPLSRGGSDGPENIVIACQPCNNSKYNKLPHEWPQGGRLL